ncbi:MAG TPA: hypothetical protein VHF69_09110, partial [Candidatus Synoicihabitans sp.]|nr:hypothetical protein [Candidatus Synoicihabitans sp.]
VGDSPPTPDSPATNLSSSDLRGGAQPVRHMDPPLVGSWQFRQATPFVQDIVLTIYPDGRMAQFFRQAASLSKIVAGTMRASPEAAHFRVKTDSSPPGYLVSMAREGETRVIERHGIRIVCRPLREVERSSYARYTPQL